MWTGDEDHEWYYCLFLVFGSAGAVDAEKLHRGWVWNSEIMGKGGVGLDYLVLMDDGGGVGYWSLSFGEARPCSSLSRDRQGVCMQTSTGWAWEQACYSAFSPGGRIKSRKIWHWQKLIARMDDLGEEGNALMIFSRQQYGVSNVNLQLWDGSSETPWHVYWPFGEMRRGDYLRIRSMESWGCRERSALAVPKNGTKDRANGKEKERRQVALELPSGALLKVLCEGVSIGLHSDCNIEFIMPSGENATSVPS
ncbi:hypothetical protein BJ508DRAFT_314718 [Ascobolus immersus RN42]|uniref:Uncharacterized protein n=1 Tax=Ascobolus immersus RN42 TaxID=1160509 RepID=A0A3N4HE03_ASCIM|nr:hypothetical protein BJ508DRAFT_314718 [Ascobolus immersus RN42]